MMEAKMGFECLLGRISHTLKRIAYKLGTRFCLFDNEDLYQEALVHLWLKFKEGELADKTDSYILQGCYFHLKNYMRKHYEKFNLVSLDKLPNAQGETMELDNILNLESRESASELINCNLLTERINNDGLTKREKEVFHLALEGLTAREIGARLGISHVRVIKLRSRIKEKSRKYVDFL